MVGTGIPHGFSPRMGGPHPPNSVIPERGLVLTSPSKKFYNIVIQQSASKDDNLHGPHCSAELSIKAQFDHDDNTALVTTQAYPCYPGLVNERGGLPVDARKPPF